MLRAAAIPKCTAPKLCGGKSPQDMVHWKLGSQASEGMVIISPPTLYPRWGQGLVPLLPLCICSDSDFDLAIYLQQLQQVMVAAHSGAKEVGMGETRND